MASHISRTQGDFITYISETVTTLNSPLVQVFVRPLRPGGNRPTLVLADAQETQDALLRHSRELDRSSTMGDLVWGLLPEHHIHLPTEDAKFKAQRRLIQDLMTPKFLNEVAGPLVYRSTEVMIDLWRVKCRMAEGRPFKAGLDIGQAVLDTTMAFIFGEVFRVQHSATRRDLEALEASIHAKGGDSLPVYRKSGSKDEPVQFPRGTVDEVLQAVLDLTGTVSEMHSNPLPRLMWAYVLRKPRISRAKRIKDECFLRELSLAVGRMEKAGAAGAAEFTVGSAADHIVTREKILAEKQKREPNYLSGLMVDEIFGLVYAGHETTSTTISWGIKFLADNPAVQDKLRHALRSSFGAASPTFEAIINTQIPYLDAVLEEILRRAGTTPIVDRVALVDTEILGHRVPKGTVVTFLSTGPSMWSPAFPIDEAQRSPTSRARSDKDKFWDPHDIGAFKPERWLVSKGKAGAPGTSDLEADIEFDGNAGPQLVFGLGPRGCFGKKLAYLQMRIMISLVVSNFELLRCPAYLSGYKGQMVGARKPTQCYVVLRELNTQSDL
ncbi:hypothetical protein SLS53_007194 [Cytospora paraplurivora]|uniref:Cytochrome P450 n=1 Tax=Cytospora paraplurivora TaxID=2898453 RepID=A0AAN9U8I8_9PEZI